jgi:hypothetical protein
MKTTAQFFGVLFTAGVFLFAVLVCLINIQWRRRKYRKMADELGAQYQPEGFTKTGEIVGCNNGRKYKIETKAFGRSGMWTIASLDCVNRGLGLSIHGGFFKRFPDWRFILMSGGNGMPAPGLTLALLNAGHPLDEKYWPQVQSLFQEMALEGNEILKKGDLKIEQNTVSFTRRGVLTKVEGIRQIVSQLAEIARRIESAPVV